MIIDSDKDYDCDVCMDEGFVFDFERGEVECRCQEKKRECSICKENGCEHIPEDDE